jgi:hypothetical protein
MKQPPVFPIPQQTLDTLLDALLIEWYELQRSYLMTRGFTKDQRTTGSYQTPGHMDWRNGAEDDRADALQVQAVDEVIHKIPNEPERWRTALEFNARNLYYRISVWYSPVLPPTKEGRDLLLLEARNKLALELFAKGVIG